MKHILLFHFFTATFLSLAQNIPIGQWRVHSPYNSSITIAVSPNQIYSSSGTGVFYIDKEDNSINPLSKITGLNDINASRVKTDPITGITVIAYSDGNVDLLKKGSVTNVSDILASPILTSKNPNDIHFFNGYAYMCYPFGISVLDPVKNQIKESYLNLAPNGALNTIYSCTTSSDGDSIYAATQNGVLGAVISQSVNLMDYTNWHNFTTAAQGLKDTARFVAVEHYNSHMYALSTNKLYIYNGSIWDTLSLPTKLNGQGKNIDSSNSLLVISAGTLILTYNGSSFSIISNDQYANVVDAVYDNQGILWIADSLNGLYSKQGNAGIAPHVPNGPYTQSSFRLYQENGTVIGLPGGYTTTFAYLHTGTLGGYYSFYDGTWTNYNISNGFPYCYDIVAADYNPIDGNFYFASYGEGIVTRKPTGSFIIYNRGTTPPAPFNNAAACDPSCCTCTFISDLGHDSKGNEWVINGYTDPGKPCLYKHTPAGIWDSVSSFGNGNFQYPILLLIDDNDYKWISFRAGGTTAPLVVYDKSATTTAFLNAGTGLGNLPSLNIYSMAKDKNGAIWVGTDDGIAIFENPSQLFNGGSRDATIPIYNQFPLMFQQQVNAIEVDGGNRKWVGTPKGAWLFSADGTQALLNFTTNNSPLSSNNILDIAINSVTGEVFFATDEGLISYRGSATEADSSYSNVKVFPNPVPHSYDGTIGISGLAKNADVKITDIYGNLVYETHAEGGTAVWNGRNYKGKAADSGVYLIFSALDDGSVSLVSKFAVIE